ncbi:MAG: ankyrin repeat domain-containing protein [Alphaproteobacteria bacterium]|nr:ankyrin repeat domain-containing protein [Alphaproteobacteria bacterium]
MAKKKNWIGILGLIGLMLRSENEKKWAQTWGKVAWRSNSDDYILKKVATMLEKGADVNLKDKKGRPLLMLLIEKGLDHAVYTVLEKGADANITDKNRVTPLMLAVDSDEKDIYDMLIAKGADINARDKYGRSVLTWAICAKNKDLALDLIEKGANLDSKDKNGITPLMEAVIVRNKDLGDDDMKDNEVIQKMIEKGVDVNAKDNDGATALGLACGLNIVQDKELVSMLKSAALIRADYIAEHPEEQNKENIRTFVNAFFNRGKERE